MALFVRNKPDANLEWPKGYVAPKGSTVESSLLVVRAHGGTM